MDQPALSEGEPGPAFEQQLSDIQRSFYSSSSRQFDFYRFGQSEEYGHFVQLARALARFDPQTLGDTGQRKAFWLNAYNGLVIHAALHHRVQTSIRKHSGFFSSAWIIGEHTMSLDDIEHGILRGNRRPPMALRTPFASKDPRRTRVLEPLDPRIHSAFYTTAISSPRLSVYRGSHLEEDLNRSAGLFLDDHMLLDGSANKLLVPKVFDWYRADFGDQNQIRAFLARHTTNDRFKELLSREDNDLTVAYLDYDWTLGGTPAPERLSFSG